VIPSPNNATTVAKGEKASGLRFKLALVQEGSKTLVCVHKMATRPQPCEAEEQAAPVANEAPDLTVFSFFLYLS